MKNNKTLSILLTVALAFANTGGGVPTYAAEDAEAVVDAAEDTGVETESDGEEVGPQAVDTSYKISGYTISSKGEFTYTTDNSTVAFSKVSENLVITGSLTATNTLTIENTLENSDDNKPITGGYTKTILDENFTGNDNLFLNINTIDITDVIPAAGKSVTIANVKAGNTVSIDSAKLDSDKYLYRLYAVYNKTVENETTTTNIKLDDFTKEDGGNTVEVNAPTSIPEGYTNICENNYYRLVLECRERSSSDIMIQVGVGSTSKVANPSAAASDAEDITRAIEAGASSLALKLDTDEDVDVFEVLPKDKDLTQAIFTAAAEVPVSIILNDNTTIEFPANIENVSLTNSTTFTITAKRNADANVADFTDKYGNSYTYKGFSGEFAVTLKEEESNTNDITPSFKFILDDLPTGLTKKTADATEYTIFGKIKKTTDTEDKTTITVDPTIAYNDSDESTFKENTIVFQNDTPEDNKWYLLDCKVVVNKVLFEANVPEGYDFEYDEESLAENYPNVYKVSENKTTLIASIPGIIAASDKTTIYVPSANAVKCANGNKPYTISKWTEKNPNDLQPDAVDDPIVITIKDQPGTFISGNLIGKTLYANWVADKAKVAFDLNFEGATTDGFAYRSSSYTEDKENNQLYVVFDPTLKDNNGKILAPTTKVTSPSMKANARPGYEFKGWSPNKDADPADSEEFYQFDFDYDYAGETTYYAIWEKTSAEVTPATVTFDANGGEFTSTPSGYTKNDKVLTVEFAAEDEADIAVPASSVLKRTGYKFLGWSPSKEGKAEALTKVNYNTGTVTFYAVWEKTSEENPGTDDPGKEEPGKSDETPSANTTPSVNYVEKTVAAATVDGKSVSVCYASKQLYQGRKLKNFDAIDYITVNGVSYNGSKVVVKVSKGKDAGSKVTFLIKKIKGESKEFNKALKAQKLTYTVEIVPVDVEKITTSKPATYEKPGTVYLKINKKGVAKAWLVTQKKADSTKRSLVRIKDGVSYDSSAKTATFTGTNVKGSAKVS